MENNGSTIAVVPYPKSDAACLIARVLVDHATGQGIGRHWIEWSALLQAEHRSLARCGPFVWARAGDALAAATVPLNAWLDAARALLPIQRRLERGNHDWTVDAVLHLVMPAVTASAAVRDEKLWRAAYDAARRHVLVARPSSHHGLGYRAPSLMFAAFRKVFSDDEELEPLLGLLPTSEHRTWAIEQLTNNPRGDGGAT
jgi:hypothetical protein